MKAVIRISSFLLALSTVASTSQAQPSLLPGEISVLDYTSIQQAIDSNPGRMIHVPPGDYRIEKKIRIASGDTGLYGYGTFIQTNTAEAIIEIEHTKGVRIRGLTLTRADGAREAVAPGLFCFDSSDVTIEDTRVIDNRAREAAIEIRECTDCTVRDCEVTNYKRVAIDDRTGPEPNLYGYAFFCIDGLGVLVNRSTGIIVRDNRIVEHNLFPTPEMKEEHNLGKLTEGRHPSKQGELGAGAFRHVYVNNWHQGSAIVVTGPEVTHHIMVCGNYIENSAQGIDLHADNVTCSGNTVNHGMMGVKATHGCRNLIISDNMLTHIDLWGILLNPGALSHFAEPAANDREARPANVDAGTIIANNIITHYGYGHEYWNWGGRSEDRPSSFAIALYEGQLDTNPPLNDILIQGNIVYDTGRDKVVVDGKPEVAPPRYRYAVYAGPWGDENKRGPTFPQNLHFIGNVFHPGVAGVSNIEITASKK